MNLRLNTFDVVQALDEAIIQMDYLGGWEFRDRAEQMLAQVGLQDSTQVVRSMSGGQKRRVALAAALLARPDLFVADEPTNHMDYQVHANNPYPVVCTN